MALGFVMAAMSGFDSASGDELFQRVLRPGGPFGHTRIRPSGGGGHAAAEVGELGVEVVHRDSLGGA